MICSSSQARKWHNVVDAGANRTKVMPRRSIWSPRTGWTKTQTTHGTTRKFNATITAVSRGLIAPAVAGAQKTSTASKGQEPVPPAFPDPRAIRKDRAISPPHRKEPGVQQGNLYTAVSAVPPGSESSFRRYIFAINFCCRILTVVGYFSDNRPADRPAHQSPRCPY